MSNPLVCQVIGGVVALFFIFLLVMCWKTWRVTHILFTFFVFAGAVTFLTFASFVLKTQAAWRKQYETLTAEIKKAEAERLKYLQGDVLAVQQSEDCIRSARAKLNDALVDRGRIWTECTPIPPAVDANTFRVRTVPASLPANAQPEPNGITPQIVLYVFAEKDSAEGWKVPAHYLGEYVVDAANDTEVTISSTLPLDPEQIQRINQGQATWALYETMPIDSHELFAEYDAKEKHWVGMDKEQLAAYIPNLFNWPQDKYDAFLEQFRRFNREATDKDPPGNTWIEVKFVKAHSIQVDSDAEQSPLEGEGRFFDSSGRAIDGRLRRGEDGTVRFEVGDTGVFDMDTADKLIADGYCQKVKPVFRRPLNDFERFFRQAYYRHQELDDSLARAKRDADTMIALKTKAEEQLAFRQAEKLQLEQDLVGFKQELAEVTAYNQALQNAWQGFRTRLSELYRTNDLLAQELTQLQFRMAQEINQRTAAAMAPAGTPAPATAPATPAETPAATPAPTPAPAPAPPATAPAPAPTATPAT